MTKVVSFSNMNDFNQQISYIRTAIFSGNYRDLFYAYDDVYRKVSREQDFEKYEGDIENDVFLLEYINSQMESEGMERFHTGGYHEKHPRSFYKHRINAIKCIERIAKFQRDMSSECFGLNVETGANLSIEGVKMALFEGVDIALLGFILSFLCSKKEYKFETSVHNTMYYHLDNFYRHMSVCDVLRVDVTCESSDRRMEDYRFKDRFETMSKEFHHEIGRWLETLYFEGIDDLTRIEFIKNRMPFLCLSHLATVLSLFIESGNDGRRSNDAIHMFVFSLLFMENHEYYDAMDRNDYTFSSVTKEIVQQHFCFDSYELKRIFPLLDTVASFMLCYAFQGRALFHKFKIKSPEPAF